MLASLLSSSWNYFAADWRSGQRLSNAEPFSRSC
jgi:hypothetical protein